MYRYIVTLNCVFFALQVRRSVMHDAGSIPQQTVLEGGHRVRAALHYSARACYGETINRTSRVCVMVA